MFVPKDTAFFYIIHYKSMISFKIKSVKKRECLITYLADTYKEYFLLKAACVCFFFLKNKPSIIFNH